MQKILKVILAGVSGRAQWVLDLAKPENGYEIVGICDINEVALTEVKESLGLPESAVHADLATTLQSVPADVLMICTPTRFHVPMAKLGMEAGLAVLTEKGMAPDWDSAQDLVAFTQKQKGLLCVAQNYRYKAMESTIKVLLDKDQQEMKMGPVYFADFTQHRVRPEPRTLNYPFASVWDMSCHHFDNMLFWFGAPESMTAQAFGSSWSAYEFPNNTSAHIVFKSGVRVHYFHGHDSAKATNELHVEGQCGAILLEGDKLRYYSRPNVQFGKSEPVEVVYPEVELPSELGVLKDFHTYVVEGKEPGISGRNNLEVMAMCQMMVMSVEQNRPVLREELNG